jgi:hypothetical protein
MIGAGHISSPPSPAKTGVTNSDSDRTTATCESNRMIFIEDSQRRDTTLKYASGTRARQKMEFSQKS